MSDFDNEPAEQNIAIVIPKGTESDETNNEEVDFTTNQLEGKKVGTDHLHQGVPSAKGDMMSENITGQADRTDASTAAVPGQADRTEASAAAVPGQADHTEVSAAEVPGKADQAETLAAVVPCKADQTEASAAAVPGQADRTKASTAAVPGQADRTDALTAAVLGEAHLTEASTTSVSGQVTTEALLGQADRKDVSALAAQQDKIQRGSIKGTALPAHLSFSISLCYKANQNNIYFFSLLPCALKILSNELNLNRGGYGLCKWGGFSSVFEEYCRKFLDYLQGFPLDTKEKRHHLKFILYPPLNFKKSVCLLFG